MTLLQKLQGSVGRSPGSQRHVSARTCVEGTLTLGHTLTCPRRMTPEPCCSDPCWPTGFPEDASCCSGDTHVSSGDGSDSHLSWERGQWKGKPIRTTRPEGHGGKDSGRRVRSSGVTVRPVYPWDEVGPLAPAALMIPVSQTQTLPVALLAMLGRHSVAGTQRPGWLGGHPPAGEAQTATRAAAMGLPTPGRTSCAPRGAGEPHLPFQVGLEGLGLIQQSDAALPPARQDTGGLPSGEAGAPRAHPGLRYLTCGPRPGLRYLTCAPCPGPRYLMCVAGRDSSCLDRNNSRCRSWCLSFSGRSTISGFSISSSISPEGQRGHRLRPPNRPTRWLPRPQPPGGPSRRSGSASSSPAAPEARSRGVSSGRRTCPKPAVGDRGDGGDEAAAAACPGPGGRDPRAMSRALPAPEPPQGQAAGAYAGPPRLGQAGAGMQPGAQAPGPSRKGGSYLPHRCRPPIRFYSRLTGLYNDRQCPDSRSASAPGLAEGVRLGGKVDRGPQTTRPKPEDVPPS